MAIDGHGRPEAVGTRVRVRELAESLKQGVPADEWQELETIVGEVFEVYGIDECGAAPDAHETEVM